MSGAQIAQRLTEAIEVAAARDGASGLVSITIDVLGAGEGEIHTAVTRKTRTLLFMNAELRAGDIRIATANSVHRVG